MHCDDKRTIFVLKQLIVNSNIELEEAMNQLNEEIDEEKKFQIQTRINDLKKTIKDLEDQLLAMK